MTAPSRKPADATPALRLQVFLSRQGVCSRRKAMEAVQAGRVKLNGRVTTEPSAPVVPGRDQIEFDGRKIDVQTYTYVMLNKPAGFVTTKADRFAPKTVLDLLPAGLRYVHPVGRLDQETEGLLILTNDGDLTQQLTHPSCGVDKVYQVRIDAPLSPGARKKIEAGLVIDGKKTSPARVARLSRMATEFELTIHEGRKRQIRRMLARLRLRVVYLKRLQQGALKLGNLPVGQYRELTREEVQALKQLKVKSEK